MFFIGCFQMKFSCSTTKPNWILPSNKIFILFEREYHLFHPCWGSCQKAQQVNYPTVTFLLCSQVIWSIGLKYAENIQCWDVCHCILWWFGFFKGKDIFSYKGFLWEWVGMWDPAWPHFLTALVSVKTQLASLKTPRESCEKEERCSFWHTLSDIFIGDQFFKVRFK